MATLLVTPQRRPLPPEFGTAVVATSAEAAIAVLATLPVGRCLLEEGFDPASLRRLERALRAARVPCVAHLAASPASARAA